MTFLLPDEILAKYLLHKYFIDNVTCGWKRADDRVELRMKIAPPDGCPQLWISGYYNTGVGTDRCSTGEARRQMSFPQYIPV